MDETTTPSESVSADSVGRNVYEDLGFTTFDSVTAVPLLIPSLDGTDCLLVTQIAISDTVSGAIFFKHLVPFEVAMSLAGGLVRVLSANATVLSKGSYKLDTQIMTRSALKALAAEISKYGAELEGLIDTMTIDDSEYDRAEDSDVEKD